MHDSNEVFVYPLFHFLVCASLCLRSRPCAQSARAQHHLGAPTAGGALQVSRSRNPSVQPLNLAQYNTSLPSCVCPRIGICLPRRVSVSWTRERESDEPKYSSLADCGGIASAGFFFLSFFFFYFCSSFNVSLPSSLSE